VAGTGVDLANSSVVWHAGGSVIAQGVGSTTATMTAGSLGSETPIEVDIQTPDGTLLTAQATVAPTQLDLLIGSDSYVPPFYQGRALPTAGTDIIAQAMANFVRADGSVIPDSDITYTWKQDSVVLGQISGRGRSSVVIPLMHLYSGNTITVNAQSSDGTRASEAIVVVPLSQASVDLYEDHPLYGVLYNNAVGSSFFVPETEMAFAAIPFFTGARTPNDSALSYTWQVNEQKIPESVSLPSELTINAANSTGQAAVRVEVTHATNFYLDSTGEWNIDFSKAGASQDAFHSTSQ
jgi:hypothetical protein